MNRAYLSRIWMTVAMATLLLLGAGCGGGGDIVAGGVGSGGTGFIAGIVTAGPLNKGTLTAYAVANGQMGPQIGTAMTDVNGNYSMSIGSYAGAVLIQVSGGSYIDEATGVVMPMAVGDVLTIVMPSVAAGANVSGIQITPITSMAQTRAEQMAGGMTDANIAAANSALGNYFSVADIVHVQPMNPLVPGSGSSAGTDARHYGIALAAMSQLAKSLNMANSSALASALMSDASDGLMDGKKGAIQISMSMGGMMGNAAMASNAGTSGLAAAMTNFMNSPANKSGLTATDIAVMAQKLSISNGKI